MAAELYAELRRLAAAKMARIPPGQTLQGTALVHEAYLRLSHDPSQRWQNRAHFFASAAEAMRRILVDQARRKASLRRAGDAHRTSFDEAEFASPETDDRLLEVHDSLAALEAEIPPSPNSSNSASSSASTTTKSPPFSTSPKKPSAANGPPPKSGCTITSPKKKLQLPDRFFPAITD
jgi:hypothetical protein